MTAEFILDVRVPAELDGALQLELQWEVGITDAQLAALRELVEGFCELADLGAYVVAHRSPVECRCRVVRKVLSREGAIWSLEVSALDGLCVRVLFNALRVFTRLHYPLRRLGLYTASAIPHSSFSASLDGLSPERTYPPRSRAVGLPVIVGMAGRPKHGRRVEITFAQRLDPPVVARVCGVLQRWATSSFMAYPATDADALSGDCAIADVACSVATEDAIELEFGHFGAASAAWDGLLNLCARLSSDAAHIVRVEIQ